VIAATKNATPHDGKKNISEPLSGEPDAGFLASGKAGILIVPGA
jgi:hypothetical protein